MSSPNQNARQQIQGVLAELGQGLSIDLSLDQDDACFFEHQDGWQLSILLPNASQVVTAVSVLSQIEADDQDVWPALVEFGWLGTATEGACLSWNPESRSLVLWQSVAVEEATPQVLNELLLKLCRVAHQTRPAISEAIFGVAETGDENENADSDALIRV